MPVDNTDLKGGALGASNTVCTCFNFIAQVAPSNNGVEIFKNKIK
jgi:hypothetical protein